MCKYAKYFFEGLITVALLAILILFIYVSCYMQSRDSLSRDDMNSGQPAMTEMHPQFSEIINELRQLDTDEINEVYENFGDNIQPDE